MNNEEMQNAYPKIDLMDMLQGILRSIRHLAKQGIALVIVLSALMCFMTWKNYTPYYEASASFTVQVTNPFYATQQHYNASAAEQMAQTFPYVLSSNALSQQVMEKLNISYMPVMNVSVLGKTNIVSLSVRSGDPQLCYDVLNCVMEVYPSVAEFVVGPTTMSLMSESGIPQAPVNSRNYSGSIAKGALLGIVIWMGLSGLYWMTHRTVGSEDDLAKLVNLECLGKIPNVRGFTGKKNSYACPILTDSSDKFGFNEAVRLMRVRVEREMEKHHSNVLLVTSTIANEGKTTLSINLALALEKKGKRVLLVDCDLRNPSVAQAMGHPCGLGLSDFLQHKAELDQVLHRENNRNLFTIRGGKPVSRPEMLLHGAALKNLIASAKNSFDYVILDTPPCALMADTAELLTMADCALLSVRQNFACRRQILEGVQIMGDSHKPILGCVMNMNVPRISSSGYSYYGYYGSYGSYGHHGRKSHADAGESSSSI